MPPQSWYRDIRTDSWLWLGARDEDIRSVLTRITMAQGRRTDPLLADTTVEHEAGGWVYEWSVLAEERESKGLELKGRGDRNGAREHFALASVYYAIGKFPDISLAEHRAYLRSVRNYEEAGSLETQPLEVIESPFDDYTVRGHLHLPAASGSKPVPLVLLTGGIDTFKTEFLPAIHEFTARGMAVFTFDIPGTGEHDFVPLSPDLDRFHSLFLDRLVQHPRIDPHRVALIGFEFGGNAAAKLAFKESSRLHAVVCVCAPIHALFQMPPDDRTKIRPVTFDTLAHRLQVKDHSPATIVERLRPFSLVEQEIIGDGKRTSVPVLAVNAKGDRLVPESDIQLLVGSSNGGEQLLLGEDRHCPMRKEFFPRVIAWVESKLQ